MRSWLSWLLVVSIQIAYADRYPKPEDVPNILRSAQRSVDQDVKSGRYSLAAKPSFLVVKGSALEDRSARIIAYLTSSICPKSVKSKPYFDQVAAMLASAHSEDVSIAIQVAGLSGNIEWIALLGPKLNDLTAASPCLLIPSRTWPYSSSTERWEYVQPTIGDLAREALYRITLIDFGAGIDFDKWYQDYPNRQNRVWYWNSRWDLAKYRVFADLAAAKIIPPLPLRADGKRLLRVPNLRTQRSEWRPADARQPIWRQPSFMVDSSFQKLDAKTGLSILLMEHETDAAWAEARAIAKKEDFETRGLWEIESFEPISQNHLAPVRLISEYVKRKKIQQELIKLMDPAPSYPSTKQWVSTYVAEYSLNATHATQISEIIGQLKNHHEYRERVAVLLARLLSGQDEHQLLDAQKLLPQSLEIASDLFFLNPNRHWSFVADLYCSGPVQSRAAICYHFRDLDWRHFREANLLFKRLLDIPGEPAEVHPMLALPLLARYMNLSAGREAVPTSLIDVVASIGYTDGSSLIHSISFRDVAYAKLKEAMLAALLKQ